MNRRTKKKLIQESFRKEIIWRNFQKKYYNKVIMLEQKGYPKDLISEAVYIDAIKGLIKAVLGSGTTSATTDTGTVEGFQLIVKEQVVQYILEKVGIDQGTLKGAAIRNGLQEAIDSLSKEDFKGLLRGGQSCEKAAVKIGEVLGTAVKDGLKENLFDTLSSKILGDAGSGMIFSGLLISMREKFSDALEAPMNDAIDQFFDSGEFNKKCAEMVCNISLVDLIKKINPNFVGDVTEYLATKPVDFLKNLI